MDYSMPNHIASFTGPPPAHSPGWAYRIGLVATLLFLGCWSVLFDVSRQLEAVVLLMFVIGAACSPARGRIARDPLLVLLIIWLLLQCITLPFAMAHFPATLTAITSISPSQLARVFTSSTPNAESPKADITRTADRPFHPADASP